MVNVFLWWWFKTTPDCTPRSNNYIQLGAEICQLTMLSLTSVFKPVPENMKPSRLWHMLCACQVPVPATWARLHPTALQCEEPLLKGLPQKSL